MLQACNCHGQGSRSSQCDQTNGTCACRQGYAGVQCDRCRAGYYGFPHCQKCDCNADGTDPRSCFTDQLGAAVCQCDPVDGQCPCKTNVAGRTCATCKRSTFGLHADNADGCTPCFCFGRSGACQQAPFVWNQVTR